MSNEITVEKNHEWTKAYQWTFDITFQFIITILQTKMMFLRLKDKSLLIIMAFFNRPLYPA